MVKLFILVKDGHRVIWCNVVTIFVIYADRIPGVLARLRSQRVLGIWGRNKISSQVPCLIIVPHFKEWFFRCHCHVEVSKCIKNLGLKTKQATGIKLKCCAFLKRVLLQVSTRTLCRATVGTNQSFLPGRIHEELLEMLHEICHPVQYIVFTSSWSRQWEVG